MKKTLFKNRRTEINPHIVSAKKFKGGVDLEIDASKLSKKVSKVVLSTAAITGLSVGLLMAVNSFFNSHYFEFRTPLVIQTPILIHDRNKEEITLPEVEVVEAVEPKPTPDPKVSFVNNGETIGEGAIAQSNNKWILNRVYRLESSAGKNDGCKYMGKFNGFGYRQNSSEHICFDTFEEVVGYVDSWFDKQLETKTLEQALCWYNEGKLKDSCTYSNNFMNL